MASVQAQAPVQETAATKPTETPAQPIENGHPANGKPVLDENMQERNGKRDRSMTADAVQGVLPSANEQANGKDGAPTSEASAEVTESAQLRAERLVGEATEAQQALQQAISVAGEKQAEASDAAKEAAVELSRAKEETKVSDADEVVERATKLQKLDTSQQSVQVGDTENATPVAEKDPTSLTVPVEKSTEPTVQDGTQPFAAEDKTFTLKMPTQTTPQAQGPAPMQVG